MNDSKNNVEDSIIGGPVNITLAAIKELKRISAEENRPLCVRFAMLGGGCSGYKVNMSFTKWPADLEFDIVFTQDGMEFLVDTKSAILLEGATLDHGGGLLDRGFKWEFPKSSGGCGCGTSFSF